MATANLNWTANPSATCLKQASMRSFSVAGPRGGRLVVQARQPTLYPRQDAAARSPVSTSAPCATRALGSQMRTDAAASARHRDGEGVGAVQQPTAGHTGIVQQLGRALAPALACAVFATQVLWAGPGDVAWARHTPLTAEERSTVQLFKDNTPAVVYITNLRAGRDSFTLDSTEMPQGAGSGIIWDDEGHVVTNLHVVKDASDLQVSLVGGFVKGGGESDFKATMVGFDENKDIAVLKINVPDKKILHPLHLGESSDLQVGQRVYAIGNPFGLDHTLTTGVISGTQREIISGINGRPIQGVIQIDAAINPGNSGGPLLDSAGELIGINTAIYSPSGASAGVGFAVPIDVLRSSVNQIIEHGRVIRPILGIAFAPEQSVEQLGVQGILVLDTRKGGPAAKAGIQGTSRDQNGRLMLGDIIVAFNRKPIRSSSDLYKGLDACAVGETVELEVLRQDSRERVPIILEPSS